MLRYTLPSLCLGLLLCCYSCKKAKQQDPFIDTYASSIAGTWLMAGPGHDESLGDGDAFISRSFIMLDSRHVSTGYQDTLTYQSTDANTHTAIYSWNYQSYSSVTYESLGFNPTTHTLTYGLNTNGYAGAPYGFSEEVTSIVFPGSAIVKKYINNIIGTRLMSGSIQDTNYSLQGPKNIPIVGDTLQFTAINDSTIQYNKDYFGVGDYVLHFRSLDMATQTVVFQTLHGVTYSYTSLTYNYAANQLTFEQHYYDIHGAGNAYLKLQ